LRSKPEDLTACVSEDRGHGEGRGVYATLLSDIYTNLWKTYTTPFDREFQNEIDKKIAKLYDPNGHRQETRSSTTVSPTTVPLLHQLGEKQKCCMTIRMTVIAKEYP
jgi:hypothetical protein